MTLNVTRPHLWLLSTCDLILICSDNHTCRWSWLWILFLCALIFCTWLEHCQTGESCCCVHLQQKLRRLGILLDSSDKKMTMWNRLEKTCNNIGQTTLKYIQYLYLTLSRCNFHNLMNPSFDAVTITQQSSSMKLSKAFTLQDGKKKFKMGEKNYFPDSLTNKWTAIPTCFHGPWIRTYTSLLWGQTGGSFHHRQPLPKSCSRIHTEIRPTNMPPQHLLLKYHINTGFDRVFAI